MEEEEASVFIFNWEEEDITHKCIYHRPLSLTLEEFFKVWGGTVIYDTLCAPLPWVGIIIPIKEILKLRLREVL